MKFILLMLFIGTFGFASMAQNQMQELKSTETITSNLQTVMVKLRNKSFRQYELTVPDVVSISSVKIGTTSFCMSPGQNVYFTFEGKQYLLLTARDNEKIQRYNLHKLVKERKREFSLK